MSHEQVDPADLSQKTVSYLRPALIHPSKNVTKTKQMIFFLPNLFCDAWHAV